MTIDEYFQSLERSLRRKARLQIEHDEFICAASDDFNGLLRCRAVFWDGSFLEICETVSTELGYPVRIHYSYCYLRGDRCVFRYDNAPHHPQVATYPHHKHHDDGRQVVPADQPTLSQVVHEIETLLSR